MNSPIRGLHHVTATVDDAEADLAFAAGVLGLRLVKKTVNFDDPFVYHFYYGDETGTPGTIWTTFPYGGRGLRHGRVGAGQVTATTFTVPAGSLDYWRERLEAAGAAPGALAPRFGEPGLVFRDPSGLIFEILEAADDRRGWPGSPIDAARAIRGLHGVTLTSRAAANTIEFMTTVLGFSVEATEGDRTRLTVGGHGPGHIVDVIDGYGRQPGMGGIGTVHHVAFAVATRAEQELMRQRLIDLGHIVTPVQDRQYFQSIYFREPGGVLFEIATSEPGFAADEPAESLGRALKLPPWQEPNRQTIEAALPPVEPPL